MTALEVHANWCLQSVILTQPSGAQLGIFNDKGPIQEKGTLKLIKEDIAFE